MYDSLEAQARLAEEHLLKHAVIAADGNLKLMAQHLGVPRSTLYYRLRPYGLSTIKGRLRLVFEHQQSAESVATSEAMAVQA